MHRYACMHMSHTCALVLVHVPKCVCIWIYACVWANSPIPPSIHAGWHDCPSGNAVIQSAPGISNARVMDGYLKTSESYNGQPRWHGVSTGYVVYMCGGDFAGRWAVGTGTSDSCGGWMSRMSSGQWKVYDGSSWIDSTPAISCSITLLPKTSGFVLQTDCFAPIITD